MSVAVLDAVAERVHKWLGALPSGWTGARLLEVADAWVSNVDKHTVEGQPAVRLCNYVDVYKNDAINDSLAFMAATATREQIRKFRIRVGDTLITKDSETAHDIGIPAYVEYEANDLICGYHLAIVRPDVRKIIPKFLYWALYSEPIARQWGVTAAGVTRVGIRSTDLNKVTIPLPSLDEQSSIANYLDRETAQIDALVAKQKTLIGLLKERRFAVRSALATQGETPDADLAPTDLVWAPEVPGTWRVVPLTSIAKLESGHTPSRSHPEWWKDVYIPWISLNDVSALSDREYIAETVNLISDAGIANSSARLLPAGTVVLSRDATIGRSAIMKVPMATSQHFADWVCGPTLNPRYLWLLFTSAMQQYFDSLTDGSTIKTIGMGDLRAFKIPLPPLEEQERIVSRAHKATASIDALIAKAEEHIALTKERRSALITAAVTGRIDVRTARKAA